MTRKSKLSYAKRKTRERRKCVSILDAEARHACFERDEYRCVVDVGGIRCPKTQGLQWSHIVTRGRTNLRWEMDNALTMCPGHHMFWWHKHPLEAVSWFLAKYPERYEKLMRMKNEYGKVDVRELAAQVGK